MKKVLYVMFFGITIICVACSKTGGTKDGGDNNGKDAGTEQQSQVPDELVGYWLAGVSSIGNFWGYDGSYQGAANEIAVGYMFFKNGTAREYFYYTQTSYYCRDQVLGYKEGTVKVDAAAKKIEMFYKNGTYRSFNTCGSSQSPGYGETKNYAADELYPYKKMVILNYSLETSNGKRYINVPLTGGEIQRYEKTSEPAK